MCDAARQLTDRLQSLGLDELHLDPLMLGDVLERSGDLGRPSLLRPRNACGTHRYPSACGRDQFQVEIEGRAMLDSVLQRGRYEGD